MTTTPPPHRTPRASGRCARTALLGAVLAGGLAGLALSAAHPEWFDASTATAGRPSLFTPTSGSGAVLAPTPLDAQVLPAPPDPDAGDVAGSAGGEQ